MQPRYYCPCCGYDTLAEEPGHYDICPICFWEDDPNQRCNVDSENGANSISLRQAQANFEQFGACDKEMIDNVIKPNNSNKRNPLWRNI